VKVDRSSVREKDGRFDVLLSNNCSIIDGCANSTILKVRPLDEKRVKAGWVAALHSGRYRHVLIKTSL